MTINKKYWNNILLIYIDKDLSEYTILNSYKNVNTKIPNIIYKKFKKKKSKKTYLYAHNGKNIIKKKIKYKDIFLNLFIRTKFKANILVKKKKIY